MVDPDMKNRRGAERIPVGKSGVIWCPASRKKTPCIVQDISETGARIRVDDVVRTPANFQLIIASEDLRIDCIVVWRSETEIGVIFETGDF
jgi:hypothetical protein